MRQRLTRGLVLGITCFAVFFVAATFTPLVYPSKHFQDLSWGETAAIILRRLVTGETYIWLHRAELAIYFLVINGLCLPFWRRAPRWMPVAFGLALGLFWGIIVDANEGASLDAALRRFLSQHYPSSATWPLLDLLPPLLKIALPILVAWLLARTAAAVRSLLSANAREAPA